MENNIYIYSLIGDGGQDRINFKMNDETKQKISKSHKKRKIIEINTLQIFDCAKDILNTYPNVSYGNIISCVNGQRVSTNGLYFRKLPTENLEQFIIDEKNKAQFRKNNKTIKQQKKVKCLNNGIIYKSLNEAARQLNVSAACVCKILQGLKVSTKGFYFEYA